MCRIPVEITNNLNLLLSVLQVSTTSSSVNKAKCYGWHNHPIESVQPNSCLRTKLQYWGVQIYHVYKHSDTNLMF